MFMIASRRTKKTRWSSAFAGAYDDMVNLVHIYELARRLLTSYTGNLVRLRRASDNAESDFTYDADGNLDTAAIAAWAGGASYVVTVYDQKGGDDITQATAANQPLFTANVQNGHAGMTFDGVDDQLKCNYTVGGQLSLPDMFYILTKLDPTAENDNANYYLLDGDNNSHVNYQRIYKASFYTPDRWEMRGATSRVGPAPTGNVELHVPLFADSADQNYWINGVSVLSGSSSGTNAADGISVGSLDNGAVSYKGWIAFAIVVVPAHSTAQRQALEAAINAYWAVY